MPTHDEHDGLPPHELGALPEERPCGEAHRDGHPGYDLHEQAVYAAELRRRAALQEQQRPAD